MKQNLEDKKWQEFNIGEIFSVFTGSLLPKKELRLGTVPRITASENNNGIFDCYAQSTHKNYRTLTNFISVSFLGGVFYHPYTASLDMKIHAVQILGHELNRHTGQFLVSALKRSVSNFSYGDQLSSTDLPQKKILLPIDSQGKPDYAYMETYMKELEQKMLTEYRQFIGKRLIESNFERERELTSLVKREWREFEMEDLFNIKSGVRLTKADMKRGNTPFIGATDSNNGITQYISNSNSSLDKNVLGVNYNGSVVENFYHPYTAVFSDDVKRITFRDIEGNKHRYLFIKAQILKQQPKYKYGYKFNARRMSKQKIMLPVDASGNPDYVLMENYMRLIEYSNLQRYMTYKCEN